MFTRRSFWGVLFGTAAAAAPVVVEAAQAPVLPQALMLVGPICPGCCNVQEIPSRWRFETQQAWVAAMTTPMTIVCPTCQTAMTVTVAR